MFVLTISRPSSDMGHFGSKTRSPGQILGNYCLHSRGHICDPIVMKLGQNVCFDNILANPILMKLGQNVCFDNILAKFEYG